jgi:hypothetical protein
VTARARCVGVTSAGGRCYKLRFNQMKTFGPLRSVARALLASLLLGPLLVTPAHAQQQAPAAHDRPDRRALIEQGKAQRLAGDEAGALASFERAHALAPSPETFGSMGASEYNLNRMVEAEAHVTEALRSGSDPWVQRNRAKLTSILQTVKSQLGWLELVGTPAGAEVEVAGRAVGRLPLPGRVRVIAGEVNVRLAMPGYRVARRDVDVDYDQVTRINIDLEKATTGDPIERRASATPARRREPGHGAAADLDGELGPPASHGASYRTAGWVTAGGAVVLAGAGVAALIVRESNTVQFNQWRGPNKEMCAERAPGRGGAACVAYLDRMNTAKTLAIVTFAGAGLAGVVSAILLSAGSSASVAAGPGTLAKAPACLPDLSGGLGGACHFSF